MGSPHPQNRPITGFQYREKPRLLHLFIGLLVSTISYAFLWLNFRNLLIDAVTYVLWAGQISVVKSLSSEPPQLVVKLLHGSNLKIVLTWQQSGLVSITVFGILFLFLLFPLKGSILLKIVWLELGFTIGLAWSFIRLSLAVLVAYYVGGDAFAVAEFFSAPLTDFFWVVSVWSLALSTLTSAGRRQVS